MIPNCSRERERDMTVKVYGHDLKYPFHPVRGNPSYKGKLLRLASVFCPPPLCTALISIDHEYNNVCFPSLLLSLQAIEITSDHSSLLTPVERTLPSHAFAYRCVKAVRNAVTHTQTHLSLQFPSFP